MKGKLISIDGSEGSGKSTQIQKIADYLNNRSIVTYATREPGGTQMGEMIRNLILSDDYSPDIDTELLLIMAARNEHIKKEIIPRLNDGQWVISDRFNDATFAYQGYGRGIAIKRISTLESWLFPAIEPDLSLLLRLPLDVAQQRVKSRGNPKDRIENEENTFFLKVMVGYDARSHLPHVKNIDASGDIAGTFAQIKAHLNQLLI